MQEDLSSIKKRLRKEIQTKRKETPPLALSMMSAKAQQRLMDTELWKNARSVALYMPVRNESDTWMLFDEALKQGKKVYLPRVEKKQKGMMHYAACNGRNDLAPSTYGILEPRMSSPACLFEPESKVPGYKVRPWPELFVLPGVAFDRRGYRLGYGGGYYDRFLAQCQRGQSTFVALAYAFQVLDNVPNEAWDKPVQCIFTDTECICTTR